MRQVAFTKDAFHEYNQWFAVDIKLIARIQELIKDTKKGLEISERIEDLNKLLKIYRCKN